MSEPRLEFRAALSAMADAETAPPPAEQLPAFDLPEPEGAPPAPEPAPEPEPGEAGVESAPAAEATAVRPEVSDDQEIELKFDNKSTRVTIAQLKAMAQKAIAGDARLRESADERVKLKAFEAQLRQVEAQIEAAKTSLGHTPISAALQILTGKLGSRQAAEAQVRREAEAFLIEQLKLDAEPPEVRAAKQRAEEAESKHQASEAKMAALQQQYNSERASQLQTQQRDMSQRLEREIVSALDSVSIPNNPELRLDATKQVASLLLQARRAGRDLTAQEAATTVKAAYNRNLLAMIGTLPPGEIAKLPKEFVEAARKNDVAQLREKLRPGSTLTGEARAKPSTTPASGRVSSTESILRPMEWRKKLAQMHGD